MATMKSFHSRRGELKFRGRRERAADLTAEIIAVNYPRPLGGGPRGQQELGVA